jgi:hypothetical protein
MKNKLIYIVFLAGMLVFMVGCEPGTGVQINIPVLNSQSEKPAFGNQIDVPGIKTQLYTPGVNPLANTADSNGRIAGLITGIWHGIISPVTLVMAIINSKAQMYEVYNNGSQYDLGFLIGVAILFLVLGVFAGRRR